MSAPERIYLQGAADAPDCEDPNSGVTWCWHQIDDTDVEYVRTDIAARATAEQSTFALQALVAAGHVSQAKVDEALSIAAATPGIRAAERDSVIEECCAAIKAEDDRMADEDYMLDSNDCIRVCRALKSQQDAAIESRGGSDDID